ncbi:hypothetical protein P7K49_025049 [Saguinus oedipus]|uniref:Uncharacterized protein n=1 Tax=Saguinus oedipus TaxID=9490 RepID=A0ABQ9UH00_SAGOE|nr:hypothetical protein P7K49_025049 [Saguinus oedipus]
METLLSEAVQLIKSLETDRAEAEEALKRQRSRKNMTNTKIDSWSVWKLQELPLAVQKEHEAYLRDVIELQWHLEGKANQLQQFEKQKTELEEANVKIQADTDYMNEHGPLLDSKQNQELQDLKIQAHERETDRPNELFGHYSSSVISVNIDIEEKEEEVTEVIRETTSSTSELNSLSKRLEDLRRVHDQLTWRKKSPENQYLEAVSGFYAAKETWDIELSDVAKDYSDISFTCTQLMEENKKLEIDINTMTEKINESIKKKSEHESAIKSLTKMKVKNDKHLKNIHKEAYHIITSSPKQTQNRRNGR